MDAVGFETIETRRTTVCCHDFSERRLSAVWSFDTRFNSVSNHVFVTVNIPQTVVEADAIESPPSLTCPTEFIGRRREGKMFFTKETLSLLKPLPKRWAGPDVLATDSEPQNLMSVNFSMITDSMTTVLASGEGFARMNEDQVRANVAVVWVLAVIVVLGLTGNALVVSAYRPRPWGAAVSPAAIFILTTAGLDIGTCLFCVPYEIFDLMDPFNNYIALCRTFR